MPSVRGKSGQAPIVILGEQSYVFDFSQTPDGEIQKWGMPIFVYECDDRLYALMELMKEQAYLAGRGWKDFRSCSQTYYAVHKLLEEHFETLKLFTKNYGICYLEALSQVYNKYTEIFMLSVLIPLQKKTHYLNAMYRIASGMDEKESHALGPMERIFLKWQMERHTFVGTVKADYETNVLSWELTKKIYDTLKEDLTKGYSFIPKTERNSDLVVVITGQFLNMVHAPTKTALDRCATIVKAMGKRVLLVNSREAFCLAGAIPFYGTIKPNIVKEWEQRKRFEFKGVPISYYQSDTPVLEEFGNILEIVSRLKPWCVVSISANVAADLCSSIVPVVTVSTVFSQIPKSFGQFSVIGRKLQPDDFEVPKRFGIAPERYYESTFTFSFKPQTHTYTRKECNLPDDKFLIVVVGMRLDDEITDEFLNCLLDTSERGGHVVFLGAFGKYETYRDNNSQVSAHTSYLGAQEDVLAVLELCDLYANPKRTGGGTSVVEAMYKGLPAVTPPLGDVYISAGDDFSVKDYHEMTQTIIRYIEDDAFYSEKSTLARQRAEVLTDSATEFTRVMSEIEKSERFH